MKKLLLLLSLFLFVSSTVNLHAQWIRENANDPNPEDFMQNMYVPAPAIAWAYLGNQSGPPMSYNRTINGGKTWQVGTPSVINNHNFLFSIFPVSANTCWIITFNIITSTGAIYKTSDGGNTWQKQLEAFQNTSGGSPDEVYFFNKNDGVAIGDPPNNRFEIWLTHNGGSTWQAANSNNVPLAEDGEAGHSNVYCTVGDNIWFVSYSASSGNTFVYHSRDKGVSWTKTDDGNDDFNFFIGEDISFTDAMHGLEKSGTMLRSTSDGGKTWADLYSTGTVFPLDITNVPSAPGVYVTSGAAFTGMSGSSLSKDYGHTWHLIDTAVDHLALGFLNTHAGYSGGTAMQNGKGGAFIFLHGLNKDDAGINNANISASDKSIQFNVAPNPVSSYAIIKFCLPQDAHATIELYDRSGHKMESILNDNLQAGDHAITFTRNNFKSGIYILRFQINNEVYNENIFLG